MGEVSRGGSEPRPWDTGWTRDPWDGPPWPVEGVMVSPEGVDRAVAAALRAVLAEPSPDERAYGGYDPFNGRG